MNEPSKKSPAEVMRELRLKMLTTSPAEFGQKPTPEYPRAYGVLMDWPVETGTVSVVSLSSGDAFIRLGPSESLEASGMRLFAVLPEVL
jgi:hypothetical protein